MARRQEPPDEQLDRLLLPHELIRDPVLGDISITALERVVIDTQAFQRLRYISQLGPTQLVYPGAVHTRFAHSLGTLHWADQLVGIANRNERTYAQASILKVDKYPHLLVRLVALLHDLAHVPFGHTLEDEGNLAQGEWEDPGRKEAFLGAGGSEYSVIPAIKSFLEEIGLSPQQTDTLIDDMRTYVLHKGDPTALDYPFVVDIVGNTLCADLLDYLDRDMYYCGLRERSGDRVVKYIAILRLSPETDSTAGLSSAEPRFKPASSGPGKGRLVLLTYRFEREHVATAGLKVVHKAEVVSEAIDLLRRRLSIVEKVYFHRTKLAAGAMLISAMTSSGLTFKDTYALSDSQFLERLQADANPRTRNLTTAYLRRRLFQPIFKLRYREEHDEDQGSKVLWLKDYPRFRDPVWRRESEEWIERTADLPPGSVAIYCPDRLMNVKEFEMLVQTGPDGEVKQLRHILEPGRRLEMEAINGRFARLWGLTAYIDPDVADVTLVGSQVVQDLSALCEQRLGYPNEISGLTGRGRTVRRQLIDRAVDKMAAEGLDVPYSAVRDVDALAARDEVGDDAVKIEQALREHLLEPGEGTGDDRPLES